MSNEELSDFDKKSIQDAWVAAETRHRENEYTFIKYVFTFSSAFLGFSIALVTSISGKTDININKAFRTILPEKDVDGFNPINVGNLSIGEDAFISCTPYGIVKMLEEYNIETVGKNAVILGRSNIVGKPMIQCMLNKNSTVTVCHSKTKNIEEIIRNADIVIAAIGKPQFVKADMVKDGAVVIDVGINRLENGTIVGDVDYENVAKKASYITPVPGGVGPMTIAMLLTNVVKAAKMKIK